MESKQQERLAKQIKRLQAEIDSFLQKYDPAGCDHGCNYDRLLGQHRQCGDGLRPHRAGRRPPVQALPQPGPGRYL